MGFKEDKRYAGHMDQLFKVNRVEMLDGRAEGAKLLDVQNGSGMNFSINISRGMDIPYLSYKGCNISFVSPCGVVAPEYFDDKELGFLKSFTAGFLTTGGLSYIGGPCEYEGKSYGLHGNVANTPADTFHYEIQEEDGNACLIAGGKLQEAVLFGDKLSLTRQIKCCYKEKKFTINDTVTNEGYKKARHMILYHMNIGYPLLTPESKIYIPSSKVIPRTTHSAEGIHCWNQAQEPDPNYEEMCFYHEMTSPMPKAAIYNPELGIGISIAFKRSALDHFVQWKMMGAGDYVIGLEPCNATIDGIEDAIANGSLKYLEPQESVRYRIEVEILEGPEEFEKIQQL